MSNHLLVLAEFKQGALRKVTFEAMAAARMISRDGKVTVVVAGQPDQNQFDILAQFGADRVLVLQHQDLKDYTTDAYFQAMKQVIIETEADGLVIGHTSLGKDLSPRIAASLGVGLISDCTAIEIQDDIPLFTRPIYAGKAFEKKKITSGFLIATIRPNNILPLEKDSQKKAKVEEIQVEVQNLRTVIKNVVSKTVGQVDLAEAKVIVAGGRGVKSSEGFEILNQLADVLGGAVGASRGACDAEYCDYSLQIGQTGKVVTPQLYFACGISGAIQHLAGMSSSRVIVAINKDPDAEIFKIADYGIVGDLFEVVPLLTNEFKKILVDS